MYRLFFASCLFGALLISPARAAAQSTGGCTPEYDFKGVAPLLGPSGIVGRTMVGAPGSPVEVRCGDTLLIADEIEHRVTEDIYIARGSVVYQQSGTRISAKRAEYNRKTQTGVFEDASGTLQLTDRQADRTLFGGQEPEAIFVAERIEKIGPKKYRLTNARFTACVQPTRRWEVTASRLTFTVDKYAVMKGATLQVKGVPMLYLPLFYYPIQEDGRATGFLMPSYGQSSFRGFTLSNAFFWAISRSQDATLYHDWFTSSGQGFGADYRFVGGNNSQGDARFYVIREKATFGDNGTLISPSRRSYEVRGNISQSLPANIKFQAQADYFTDVTTQQFYQVDLASFSRRSRYMRADLSANYGRLRFWVQGERNDVFYGTSGVASLRHQPRTNVSISETPLLGKHLSFSASVDTTNAVRYEDTSKPESRLDMFRSDATVTLRAPLRLGDALSLNAGVTVRRTDWDISRDPVSGEIVDVPLTRRLVETRLTLRGPNFSRIFNTPGNGYAERFKHVIAPRVEVRRTSSFDRFAQVVQLDGVDTVLGGLTQVTYAIDNSLLARIRQTDGPPQIQTVMRLSLSQTYYTNKLAASYDQQYQSSFSNLYSYTPPPSNFSPVKADLSFTPSEQLGGQFGLEYDTQFRAIRQFTGSFRTAYPLIDFNANWTKRQVIPGLIGYDNPASADHFISGAIRLNRSGGGGSLGYSSTYDILRGRILQHRFTGFFNAQCCGVSVDYAVTNLQHLGLRNDKRFSISLALAGIGSFTNPLGVFGSNGIQR